ncbi:MAG: hypothetical protein NT105_23785 [Verrucomicrobia bacterium]|nr:hypothetical protein [Verrucomicrobiota bacterium]
MNPWIASILLAVCAVAGGVLMAKLFIRLWNFSCPPVPPAPRSPLPQDRATAAAAKMVAAALLIEERLYESDAVGTLLEEDELLQLEQARQRLAGAFGMLHRYQTRYASEISQLQTTAPAPSNSHLPTPNSQT